MKRNLLVLFTFLGIINYPKTILAQTLTGILPDYAEYTLSNSASGKFIEVTGDLLQNEKYNDTQKIVQYAASITDGVNTDRWQKWYIEYEVTENNIRYFFIRNAFSGKVIDVPASTTVSGTPLQQYLEKPIASDNQLWKVEEVSTGVYHIINKGNGLALTNAGSSTGNANPITQETLGTGSNQKWILNKQTLDSYRDDKVVRFFNRNLTSQGSVAFDQGSSIPLASGKTLWITQDSWDGGSLQSNNMFKCDNYFSYGNSIFVQPSITNWDATVSPNLTRNNSAQGKPKQMCDIQPGNTFAWPANGVQIGNKVYMQCTEGNGLAASNQVLYVLTENDGTLWTSERTSPAGMSGQVDIDYASGMVKQDDGYVYVFGARATGFGYTTDVHVARFPISNPQSWTFWNGSSWTNTPTTGSTARIGEAKGSASVSYINGKYVMVTMDQGFNCDAERNIYVKTASSPTAGFNSTYTEVYSIKEYLYGQYARYYSPQIHPQFRNNNDELLITYSLNYSACGVDGCKDGYLDPYFYRVKGIRIPYSKIGIPTDNKGPLVSITSPANDATYTAPAAVSITTNAYDSDGTVDKVEFYNGTTKLGEDISSPFSFNWNNVAAGTYTITAKATDNDGAAFISPAVKIIVSNTVNGNGDGLTGNYFNGMNFETPVYSRKDATINFDWGTGSPNTVVNADQFSVRWTGQIQPKYSGEYTFYINSDNGRRLWVNGQLVIDKWIDDWNIEYSGKITLTASQKYDIKIEYFEDYGGASCNLQWSSALQTKEVIPTSQLYSNALPTVTLTSPTNNATFNAPASITINANASDNISVAKVEFYNSSVKLGEDATSPYSFSWTNVAVGTYTITARATDNLGGIVVSAVVTVKVNTTVIVNKAPAVSLTSPSNGTSYNAPASISVSANASDADGTVSKVDFYAGTTLLGTDAASPYTYTWTNAGAGTYTISAKATDNSGATTSSASVTVTVKTVATNVCSTLPTYSENNGYVAGSKVKNVGEQYECKEYPYTGWCNGAAWAYAPGTGSYWTDAWYDRGSCAARYGADPQASSDVVIVSPNPTSDAVTIHLNSTSNVTIYNAQGLEVQPTTTVIANGTINISSLSSGIYMFKIDTGSDVLTQMVVKN